jgi:branched-chain amino acid transport system ATP-binding protein
MGATESTTGAAMQTAFPPLVARDLSLAFGGLQVLKGVDLAFQPGQVTGLIGPNGAGKTSLFNCLTGLYRAQIGRIVFGDLALEALSPSERAAHGIARSFQHVALCPDMTVLENVMVGLTLARKTGWIDAFLPLPATRGERAAAALRAMAALEEFGIAEMAALLPRDLPPGPLRLVEIARAIVGTPRVLLLDEPAAGLNAVETRDLMRVLRGLIKPSLVIVVVEHDMDLIMQLCDAIYVLNFGKIISHGTPQQVRADPEVLRIYLGEPDA